MARIQKIIIKINSGSKNVRKSEAITLLEHFGFSLKRITKHTEIYSNGVMRISVARKYSTLHSSAVKELRVLLEEFIDN